MYGIKRNNTGGHSWWGNTEAATDIKIFSAGSNRVRALFGSTEYGTETYAILGPNGSSFSRNLSDNFLKRVKGLHSQNKRIKFIHLFANNAFFISNNKGTQWGAIGTHCANELHEAGQVDEIAVARDGSWVVIRPDGFLASTSVDSRLMECLVHFYHEQKQQQVEFQTQEIHEYHERIEHKERERREREEREAKEL